MTAASTRGWALAAGAATAAPVLAGSTAGWALLVAGGLAAAGTAARVVAPASEVTALVSFALGSASLVVSGQERLGALYVVAAVAFVVASMLGGSPRAVGSLADRRAARAVGLGAAIAATVAATGMVALPRMADALQRALGGWLFEQDAPEVAFSESIHLGAMRELLQRRDVALRVYGAKVDYLRGVAYDTYALGRWRSSQARARHPVPSTPMAPGDAVLEQRAGRAFFMPLGACGIGTLDGPLSSDGAGVVAPSNGARAARAWLAPRCDAPSAPPSAPAQADLRVPPEVRAEVAAAATSWTAGAAPGAAQAEAIERALRQRRYALDVPRDADVDPLVDFLDRHPAGHCEYFASAMALAARSLGLPARVVAGYRVTEHNALGGWWVVRDRDAHAWVEAWVDGAWRTFDPTPPSALGASGGPLDALLDVVGRAYDRTTAGQLILGALALAAALGAWLVGRRLLGRLGRSGALAAVDAPPTLARIERALATHGHERPAWESLEAFAARLPPERAPAADLLRRFARTRYGGLADPSLEGDVERLAR